MNRLAVDLMKRAEGQAEAALAMLNAPDFGVDAKKQAHFVVGQTTAKLMHVMAEILEFESGEAVIDENQARRQEARDAMDAMRTAAAKGDWDEWERLVEGHANGSDADGD